MNEIVSPIVLILTVVGPNNFSDSRKLSMPTVDECFIQARAWDDRGLTQAMKDRGAIRVRAACEIGDMVNP